MKKKMITMITLLTIIHTHNNLCMKTKEEMEKELRREYEIIVRAANHRPHRPGHVAVYTGDAFDEVLFLPIEGDESSEEEHDFKPLTTKQREKK